MAWLCGVILFVSLAIPTSADELSYESGQAIYRTHNADTHKGGETPFDIAEDAAGNIYVANEEGLIQYDGEVWSNMPETGQGRFISSVAVAPSGEIWVTGTKSIGFYTTTAQGNYQYVDRTASVLELANDVDIGAFWKLYARGESIYLITSTHVLRWDGQIWKAWDFESTQRILPSWSEGYLYIHARGSGLYRIEGATSVLVAPETAEVASGIISVMDRNDQGQLCATVANGLFYLKNGQFQPLALKADPMLIYHASQLRDGRVALSTSKSGYLLYDPSSSSLQAIYKNESPFYYSIEDRKGTLWAANPETILEVPKLGVTQYHQHVQAIVKRGHQIYFTNTNELKVIQPKSEGSAIQTIRQIDVAMGLHSTGKDVLYGASKEMGIIGAKNQHISIPFPRHILKFTPSFNDPTIIYSSDSPRISRWQYVDQSWQYLDTLDQFSSRAISMVELPNGKLLISSDNSALLLADWPGPDTEPTRSSSIQQLGPAEGLHDKFIWAHCLRSGDTVVIITNEGIYVYDADTETFHYDDTLGGNLGLDAYGLESCELADQTGWILRLPTPGVVSNPIGRLVVKADGSLEWTALQLPSLDLVGKVRALLHEAYKGREILWVGGGQNLLRYDLDAIPEHPSPVTRLTSILENEQKTAYYSGAGPVPTSFEWPYPQKTIRFSYTAPPAPLQVMGYQTRLVGFNETWSKTSDLLFREFTNLSFGDYTFEVRVVDEFGRTGEATRAHFTILPPWYRTAYAYAGYVCAGIAFLVIAGNLNSRRLRLQNEKLERLVNQRTYELEEQKLELLKANKAKQNFLASMSHEIRNPLNGIIGIARLLHQQEQAQGTPSEQITHLHTCSRHLHQLLGQTLDYSSLEAGKLRTQTESFDPAKLMEDVMQIQNEMAQEKGIQLILEPIQVPYRWKGDPVFLRQILINLVSNGIKYTPEGSVRLSVAYEKAEDSVKATFTVTDTGPGIPPNQQKRIFQEFTRLEESQAQQIPGTGLGLTISAEMAKLMGGELRLDGNYTGGARFVLELEFGIDLFASAKDPAKALGPEPLKGKRVLIADDMQFNRFISAEVLRSLGAEIDQAENGRIALEKLRETSYDLALLDISMPEMTGPEAVEAFLRDHEGPTPEFFALSAYNTPEMEAKCLASGFNHFIEKPLDPDKLISRLKKHKFSASAKARQPVQLLDYLSQNGSRSLDELQNEYKACFKQEIDKLRLALIKEDSKEQREIIHKLLGLCNIHPNPAITSRVEDLSNQSKQEASRDTLAASIEELEAQIEKALS